MTKVYPNTATERPTLPSHNHAEVLTVWNKSLLYSCKGFTVFDAEGNLVFRVDTYAAGIKGVILLMDATGKPLLTIRRKKLSLANLWLGYDGETTVNPLFSVKKHVNFLSSKALAHVTSSCSRGSEKNAMYQIEGSYAKRCCVVYDDKRKPMAEINLKEAVGGIRIGVDVFRLVVQPEFDAALAMALVIVLEQMFESDGLLTWVRI